MPLSFELRRFEFGRPLPAGLPIPPVKHRASGFDAILQLRSDLLTTYASNVLPSLSRAFDYGQLSLPGEIDSYFRSFEKKLNTPSIIVPGLDAVGLAPPTFQLDSISVLVYSVQLVRDASQANVLFVEWDVSLSLRLQETEESYRQRREGRDNLRYLLERLTTGPDASFEPPPKIAAALEPTTDRLSRWTPDVAHGSLRAKADLEVVTNGKTSQSVVRLTFAQPDPKLYSSDKLFHDMMDAEFISSQTLSEVIRDTVATRLTGTHFTISPPFSIVGSLRSNEGPIGLNPIKVQFTTSASNDSEHWVFHLCVSVGPQAPHGDLTKVRPFVGDSNFAYYASEPIVESALRLRWDRADTPKVMTGDVPLYDPPNAPSPKQKYVGRAKVKIELQQLREINFVPAIPGSPDPIEMVVDSTIQVTGLWDKDDDPIGFDELAGTALEGLETPVTEPIGLMLLLFEGGALDFSRGGVVFLHTELGPRILEPIYRPLQVHHAVRNIYGHVSSPLRSVFWTGDLEMPSLWGLSTNVTNAGGLLKI